MIRIKKYWIVILVAFSILSGCYYDKEELLYPVTNVDCSTVNARFTDVKSIIALRCATAGCHNSGTAAGGAVLETYDQIRSLAGRITQRVITDKTMPPGAPLSPDEIATIKCWINSGTPNN